MSHFTTAVSLSGVAKTWSRSTLQSFQDFWKYPLHVFSCMCAWVRVWGFYRLIPIYGCSLSLPHWWLTSWNGKKKKIFSFLPSQPRFSVYHTAQFLIGVNSSIYLFMLTLKFCKALSAMIFIYSCWVIDRKWDVTERL